MRNTLPIPVKHHSIPNSYVPSTLSSTLYVYIRVDGYRHPLQRPYNGPFRIISTSDKYFTLDINGRLDNVSIDRLKPAFVGNNFPTSLNSPGSYQPTSVSHPTTVTIKYGRTIRPPKHLTNDHVSAVALQNAMSC